jgi:hypothetical protein
MDELRSVILSKKDALDIDAAITQVISDFRYAKPPNETQARFWEQTRARLLTAWARGTPG